MMNDAELVHTRKHFPEHLFEFVKRKQSFPYDWVTDSSKYDLPFSERSAFYNNLTKENISEERYLHALNFYKAAGCTDMGTFSDKYLLLDTLLLTDCFLAFRNKLFSEYKIDPCHYLTLPHYAWDSMLFSTKVKIELLTEIDMVHFFLKGCRGGITNSVKKFSKASNKYVGEENVKDEIFLALFDAVSLYSWALKQPLPAGDFRWMTQQEIDDFDLSKIDVFGDVGFVLEVDLNYCRKIHHAHQQFPFCPEYMIPPNSFSKHPKLLCTLYDKKKYVIHYRMLKLALKHGLILEKIHRGISFRQARILEPYIDKTIALRQAAKNDFEKTIFKFCCNSIYGRCLMNTRNRLDLTLCTDPEQYQKLVCDNFFKRSVIYDDNLAAVHRLKKYIKHSSPVQIAQCILDVSKCKIYEFYYEFLLPNFKDSLQLILQDTDSLLVEAKGDLYKFMSENMDQFDTSDFPKDHSLHSDRNKKIPGVFTEEFNGDPIKFVVSLRPKMYSVTTVNSEKKRGKGVKTSTLQKEITVSDYLDCLFQRKDFSHDQCSIISKKHVLYTVKTKKKTLSSYDDKRMVENNGITTISYGYCYFEDHRLQLSKVHEELLTKFSCEIEDEENLQT
nr:PREDICTED: uncharacterized protein LOC109041820 [Bemisia tabaci]